MNRPCRIHFHEDSAPSFEELPTRYQKNVEGYDSMNGGYGPVDTLLVQIAFLIDFAPHILRTRVDGTKEEDPVDFPLSSISFVEWFYGEDVPEPLRPWVPREPRSN